jgi:hypothetical protein
MGLNEDARAGLYRILLSTKDPDRIMAAWNGLREIPKEAPEEYGPVIPLVHVDFPETGRGLCGAGEGPLSSHPRGATCVSCLRMVVERMKVLPELVHAGDGVRITTCGAKDIPARLMCTDGAAATCVDCLREEIYALRKQRDEERADALAAKNDCDRLHKSGPGAALQDADPSHHFVRVTLGHESSATFCGRTAPAPGLFRVTFSGRGPDDVEIRRVNCLDCLRIALHCLRDDR